MTRPVWVRIGFLALVLCVGVLVGLLLSMGNRLFVAYAAVAVVVACVVVWGTEHTTRR